MPKYRKKPVVIEAIQFMDTQDSLHEVVQFMDDVDSIVVSYRIPNDPKLKINTLECIMEASVGDYIIKGINGEFYPCKPDIFFKTYERIE